MTKEEYNDELNKIETTYRVAKSQLYRKFALINNPYKVGDKFTDHIGTIRIESIQVAVIDDYPSCYYTGYELNKSGSINKRKTMRNAYQINETITA